MPSRSFTLSQSPISQRKKAKREVLRPHLSIEQLRFFVLGLQQRCISFQSKRIEGIISLFLYKRARHGSPGVLISFDRMMINFIDPQGSADEWKTWVYVVHKTICLKNNSSSLTSSCLVQQLFQFELAVPSLFLWLVSYGVGAVIHSFLSSSFQSCVTSFHERIGSSSRARFGVKRTLFLNYLFPELDFLRDG